MAHWRSEPRANSLLLAHEYFHWLVHQEGRAAVPIWFNEGLAFNISWRISQRGDSWLTPFPAQRQWWANVARASTEVPDLARHRSQDDYIRTAVALLLETRDRGALVRFFSLTRAGSRFDEAFSAAFGVTPAAFQREYEQRVAQLRAAA
jgi:hypothetical protein